jgi:hypothetical protein
MKTDRKASKNICKSNPFLMGFKHIRIRGAKSLYSSGFPPPARSEIPSERAVNRTKIPQCGG